MDARKVAPVELREGRRIGPRALHQFSLIAFDIRTTVHSGKCAGVDRADRSLAREGVTTVGTRMVSRPMPTIRPSAVSATTLYRIVWPAMTLVSKKDRRPSRPGAVEPLPGSAVDRAVQDVARRGRAVVAAAQWHATPCGRRRRGTRSSARSPGRAADAQRHEVAVRRRGTRRCRWRRRGSCNGGRRWMFRSTARSGLSGVTRASRWRGRPSGASTAGPQAVGADVDAGQRGPAAHDPLVGGMGGGDHPSAQRSLMSGAVGAVVATVAAAGAPARATGAAGTLRAARRRAA